MKYLLQNLILLIMPDNTTPGNVSDLFLGFPIDYFKILPNDLNDKYFGGLTSEESEEVNESYRSRVSTVEIQPDPESGRVYDALSEHLNLQTKDTTVINIGVGQGKTYTILKTVQKYFTEHPDTYIIVAVPYVSLVSQYVEELIANGIPENQIYKYEWLNPKEFPKSTLDYQLQRRVHVVTANCLLGNAGENAAINSRIKRKYLKEFPKALNPQIIKYDGRPNPTEEEMEELFLNLTNSQINELNGNDDLPVNPDKIYDSTKLTSESLGKKKVIFIFDELHDAVHNFTAENILHLYLWKDVLHKIFVLSATYNDPSLVVINKLSELTDEKIKIIEATRKQIESKLSDLHIHFDNSYSFKENEKLKSIIQDAISQRKSIDILCYSKKLAENIYAGEVGALLRNYSPNNVKLCVSELIQNQRTTVDEPKNRYDSTKINIGTNFKTGINITKENHCFVIVMPPYSSKMAFENLYGIFSGGYIDLIQSVARQRIPGEIHIITMYPDYMSFRDGRPANMTSSQYYAFKESYNEIRKITPETYKLLTEIDRDYLTDEMIVKYIPVNFQTKIISDTVKEYIQYMANPIMYTGANGRDLKEYFRLNLGKLQLQKNKFLYGDIAANLIINAFMNQFINCKLVSVNFQKTDFTDDNFPSVLDDLFSDYVTEEVPSFKKLYNHIKNKLSTHVVTYNGKNVKPSDSKFSKKLLLEILRKYYPESKIDDSQKVSPHHVIHALMNSNDESLLEIKDKVKEVFKHFNSLIVENEGSKYLPTKIETIGDINSVQLYNDLSESLPVLKDTKFFVALPDENQNIEATKLLKNLFTKSFGDFDKSEEYTFSEVKLKKIINHHYPSDFF